MTSSDTSKFAKTFCTSSQSSSASISLREQLAHLLRVSVRTYISIRVIPASVGIHAGTSGGFYLMEFPKFPTVVYLESLNCCLFFDDTETVEVYENTVLGVERISAALQVRPTAAEPAPGPRNEQSWAEQQRQRLPAHKTSGIYLDPDGHTELVQSGSEPDGEHDRINAHLVAAGAIPPVQIEATKHVEMKVAWRMRQGGVDRVDLVINNKVCGGRMSCTRLLPHVLLPGQTLVIHDPVRSREIRGKDDQ